jgi:hypothetical protein
MGLNKIQQSTRQYLYDLYQLLGKVRIMRSEVVTTMKCSVLSSWVGTPCELISRYQHFREIWRQYFLQLLISMYESSVTIQKTNNDIRSLTFKKSPSLQNEEAECIANYCQSLQDNPCYTQHSYLNCSFNHNLSVLLGSKVIITCVCSFHVCTPQK